MRLSSLRTRVLLVGVLTASLVVGTLSLTSFFVISVAMHSVAEETTMQIGEEAAGLVRHKLEAEAEADRARGLSGQELREHVRTRLLADIGELLRTGGFVQGAFALYDQDMRLVWASGNEALVPGDEPRRRAIRQGRTVESAISSSPFSGIFAHADLGRHFVHVPIVMPDSGVGVLDVVYRPIKEEALLDSMRPTMVLLSVLSVLLAILMTQVSMSWVLRLVDDLRRATDRVDEGDLNVQLPDAGPNEIGDLTRSLNALIARLRRRAEGQTRFVADASHELATPVAGIRGYVNILREWGGEDPEVREEAIRAVDRESRRMARLCGELLSMIRSEETSLVVDTAYDLNTVSREALATTATRYMDKGIEFIGPDEGTLALSGDPHKIEEMLGVLLDNAGKYTDPGGTVRVRTWREGERAVVEVSDTGIGIAEHDLPNIFDRFYRSDGSRSHDSGGFGLGLAIARNIVESSGGTIVATSMPGDGTTFKVSLPLKRD